VFDGENQYAIGGGASSAAADGVKRSQIAPIRSPIGSAIADRR
jgi:hypothetical protein